MNWNKVFGKEANGSKFINIIGTFILLLLSIVSYFIVGAFQDIVEIRNRQRDVMVNQSEMKTGIEYMKEQLRDNKEAIKEVDTKFIQHLTQTIRQGKEK